MGAFNITAGDYLNTSNSTIISNSTTSSAWTGAYRFANTWIDNGSTYYNWTQTTKLTKAYLDEIIEKVFTSLQEVCNRYKIFGPKLANADVVASKAVAAQLPKDSFEFKVSKKLSDGKRNVYLVVKLDEFLIDPITMELQAGQMIVDLCSSQYGNFDRCQQVDKDPPAHWDEEFSYKSPTSLVKRLAKEGRPLGELALKDAIALSTRYEITASPTELETHLINPGDSDGQKFLQKFGKEVGFKTTLAQLLLDEDPVIASKAKEIAEIILKR